MEYNLMTYYVVVNDLKMILKGRCAKTQRRRLINDIKEFSSSHSVNDLDLIAAKDDLDINDLNVIIFKIYIFYDYLVNNQIFPYSNAFIQDDPIHDVSALKPDFPADLESFASILRNSLEIKKLKEIIESKHYTPFLKDSLAISIDILFYEPHCFAFDELWEMIEALLEFNLLQYEDSIVEKETDEGFAEFYIREYSIDLNNEK